MKHIQGKLTLTEVSRRHAISRAATWQRLKNGRYTHPDGRNGCHCIDGYWYVDVEAVTHYENEVMANEFTVGIVMPTKTKTIRGLGANALDVAIKTMKKSGGTIAIDEKKQLAFFFGKSTKAKLAYAAVIKMIKSGKLIAWHTDVRWHYYRPAPEETE